MWAMLRIALVASYYVVYVAIRRLFRGPLHEGWSYRMELVVSIMRREAMRGLTLPVPAMRAGLRDAPVPRRLRPLVTRDVTTIAGVPAEVVTPREHREVDPTVLYLHGGGYVFCSPGTHRDFITRICVATRARCIALDYGLAPEYPFPTALDQSIAAYNELLLATPNTRIYLGGDSAGGGLSLATVLKLRDEGRPLPAGAFLFSPWVDLTMSSTTMESNAKYDFIQKELIQVYAAHYLGGRDATSPLISPVNGDYKGIPPLWIHSGGAEIFFAENQLLVERARAAGVDVTFHVDQSFVHVVPAFSAVVPEGLATIENVGRWFSERTTVVTLEAATPEQVVDLATAS